jgi:hypothetical protein
LKNANNYCCENISLSISPESLVFFISVQQQRKFLEIYTGKYFPNNKPGSPGKILR